MSVGKVVTSSYIPSALIGKAVTSEPGRSRYEWRNQRSFAAIKSDGSIVSWGSIKGTDGANIYRYSNQRPISRSSAIATLLLCSIGWQGDPWGTGGHGGGSVLQENLQDGVIGIFHRVVPFRHSSLMALLCLGGRRMRVEAIRRLLINFNRMGHGVLNGH